MSDNNVRSIGTALTDSVAKTTLRDLNAQLSASMERDVVQQGWDTSRRSDTYFQAIRGNVRVSVLVRAESIDVVRTEAMVFASAGPVIEMFQ